MHRKTRLGIFLEVGPFFWGFTPLSWHSPIGYFGEPIKKELLSFVSALDEAEVSGKSEGRQFWIALTGLIALVLAALVVFYLVRAK